MNHLSESQPVHRGSSLHLVSVTFACVACLLFLAGSILIYLSWASPARLGISSYYTYEGSFVETILLLVVIIPLFWLFGTLALLLERRWVIAALLLPAALAIFIGCYLFLVFVASYVPGGPKVSFLVLLVPLNVLLCRLAWRLVIRRPVVQ